MLVRPATVKDVDAMVALGRAHHPGSSHGHVPFSDDHAGAFAIQSILHRGTCALVATHDGRVVGFLIGAVQDWPFLPLRVATDLVTLSTRAGAGSMMYREFERWAFAHGADEISLSFSYGGAERDRCDKMLERKGFTRTGGLFFKRKE